jgi:hypothetical protein
MHDCLYDCTDLEIAFSGRNIWAYADMDARCTCRELYNPNWPHKAKETIPLAGTRQWLTLVGQLDSTVRLPDQQGDYTSERAAWQGVHVLREV